MTGLFDWLEKRRVFVGSIATIAVLGVGALLAWIDWHPPKTETVVSRSIIKQDTVVSKADAASSETTGVSVSDKAKANSEKKTGKININTATVSELDALPAIGKTYAQRIVDYRNTHGGFKSTRDLINVKGIGEATLAKIKDLVTTGGE